jgi:hypothetical protein
VFNIPTLQHNPAKIREVLKKLPDKRLITTHPLTLYFPERFVERDLASVGSEIYCIGYIGMCLNDQYYANLMVCAMVKLEPSGIMKTEFDGDVYYKLMFEAGDTVMSSTELVKTDILSYNVYNEFIASGKVPTYMGYIEMAHIFDTAGKHAGANVGERTEITEVLVSLNARDAKDRRKYYRETVTKLSDVYSRPPVILPLKSVEYSPTDTLTKLAGSYWDRALTSALVNPSQKTERIESLLRS